MKDIYRSLTENNGEAGILKNLLDEDELNDLKTNPFHITGTDIRVRKHFEFFLFVILERPAPGSIQQNFVLLRFLILNFMLGCFVKHY